MTTALRPSTRPSHTRRARPSTHVCKLTMASTGIVFAAFVFVHMVGNLKIYLGAADLDHYATWLRTVGTPLVPTESVLWTLRIVLTACLLAHVVCAVILWRRARARRGGYRAPLRRRMFAAGTMPYTGLALLAFIVFHILDLTTGQAAAKGFQETTATQSHAYANVIASFDRPLAALAYVVAMLALSVHVVHGLWMAAHDLGVTGRRTRAAIKVLAWGVALAVLLGNASIPVAVQLGWLS